MDKKCSYQVDQNGIAVIEINNPPMNALSSNVLNDIKEAVIKAIETESVKVIIITGKGKSFIAGADLKELKEIKSSLGAEQYLLQGQEILNKIENSDKPFIAAVNGFCLGGGMELMLACHIALIEKHCKLGLPEINLGLFPAFGGTQRITKYVGMKRAYEFILTGNIISAKEAENYGIVNKIVSPGKVLIESMKLAKVLSEKSRTAIKYAIQAIKCNYEYRHDKGQEIERKLLGKIFETEDKKEGITAFLEKRKPIFKN